jgi:hypothetical protein
VFQTHVFWIKVAVVTVHSLEAKNILTNTTS